VHKVGFASRRKSMVMAEADRRFGDCADLVHLVLVLFGRLERLLLTTCEQVGAMRVGAQRMVGQSAGMANAAADGVSVRTLAARHFEPLCCDERVLCVNMMNTTKSGRMLHRLRGGTKAGFQMFNSSTLFRTPDPDSSILRPGGLAGRHDQPGHVRCSCCLRNLCLRIHGAGN